MLMSLTGAQCSATIARMDDDTDYELEALRAQSAASAAPEGDAAKPEPSALPHDAERPSDAAFLMQEGMTPLEYLSKVMCGLLGYDRGRVECAKACIPYYHAARPSKQHLELSGDANVVEFAKALRSAGTTRADLAHLLALEGEDAKSIAAKPH